MAQAQARDGSGDRRWLTRRRRRRVARRRRPVPRGARPGPAGVAPARRRAAAATDRADPGRARRRPEDPAAPTTPGPADLPPWADLPPDRRRPTVADVRAALGGPRSGPAVAACAARRCAAARPSLGGAGPALRRRRRDRRRPHGRRPRGPHPADVGPAHPPGRGQLPGRPGRAGRVARRRRPPRGRGGDRPRPGRGRDHRRARPPRHGLERVVHRAVRGRAARPARHHARTRPRSRRCSTCRWPSCSTLPSSARRSGPFPGGYDQPITFFELVGDTVWGATAALLRQLLGMRHRHPRAGATSTTPTPEVVSTRPEAEAASSGLTSCRSWALPW